MHTANSAVERRRLSPALVKVPLTLYPVTAPWDASDTVIAYLWKTPEV